MPTITIPTALRQYAGGQASVNVTGATIGATLESLTAQHPDLKKHLYDAQGKLRSFVNVYLGDEDIRHLQKEATPVAEDADISIIPAIAGGAVVWALSWGEAGSAILLVPPSTTPLSVRILTLLHFAPTTTMASLALIGIAAGLLGLAVAVVLLTRAPRTPKAPRPNAAFPSAEFPSPTTDIRP